MERHPLLPEAEWIVESFQSIRRVLRRRIAAEICESELTAPQLYVLAELADRDGQTLTELSRRAALSHSTVSGIVDRLERQGLVRRRPDERDRRFVRICLADHLRDWVRAELPARRLRPVLEALAIASPEERALVVEGLATFRRLLAQAANEGAPRAQRQSHILV